MTIMRYTLRDLYTLTTTSDTEYILHSDHEAALAEAVAKEREACALMCQAKGEEAMARAVSPEKWNPRDPVYYSSHQEGIAKAHFEDAEAIRARGAE